MWSAVNMIAFLGMAIYVLAAVVDAFDENIANTEAYDTV